MRAILALCLLATPLLAHDLWLIPPEKATWKEPAIVLAHSGMDFPTSVQAPNVKGFAQANVYGPKNHKDKLDPLDAEGKSGRLRFTPSVEGIHVLAVETSPKRIELDAEQFNAYLLSDGLPHIHKLRVKEKTNDQPGKEQYRKSVKAIVRVGNSNEGAFETALGLPLEIVPKTNPLTLKPGMTLAVAVLFDGQALADAHLGWANPGDGDEPRGTVRTNAKGEALIPIARTGLMTVRLTHMTRPRAASHEWESFWTTLTFRVDP